MKHRQYTWNDENKQEAMINKLDKENGKRSSYLGVGDRDTICKY